MLYPARCKKKTVDQSKVLKNRLFRFFGPPGIEQFLVKNHIFVMHLLMADAKFEFSISFFGNLLSLCLLWSVPVTHFRCSITNYTSTKLFTIYSVVFINVKTTRYLIESDTSLTHIYTHNIVIRQLRARRALLQLKDVPLRTRRALLLYR